ncbi:MAG: hypothetical protein MUF54_04430 [Polyangiaceae bacterium]|jgi:multicomponent Na+:H+ antiporter subunit D|nr:hypothetical protein [Polyangiaceae bacterium]
MNALLAFVTLFALPIVGALGLWLARRTASTARWLSVTVGAVLVAVSGWQVANAASGDVFVHAFGGWSAPFGIVFVVDRLSAVLVVLADVLYLSAVLALRPGVHGERVVSRAAPLLLLLLLGLHGAFMTGDLFNLFVMFELVLISSYLLLQVPGSSRSLRSAFPNVVINLLASLLFFGGVGTFYGLVGSVNLADLATRLPLVDPSLRWAALSMIVVAFGTKAALLPVVFWLPGTYPTPSAPIASFFAGIMTKLGAYSLLRISPLLLAGTSLPTVLVWVGAASALLGVLAALSQTELRRLLAFHSVSQMGYVVASLGLLSVAGIAGALYFLVHHALVKASLYLVADELERRHGHRDLRRMPVSKSGSSAMLGGLFLAAATTLAGLPPTSGFIAKVSVFVAGMDADAWVPLTALVLASLFTLASMLKIWQFAFQGTVSKSPLPAQSSTCNPWLAPLGGLVALTVLLSASAGPSLRFARSTAEQLLDVDAYVTHVKTAPGHGLGRQGVWR